MDSQTGLLNLDGTTECVTHEQPVNNPAYVPMELVEKMIQEQFAEMQVQQKAQQQKDPQKYFSGKRFVPKWLAEDLLGDLAVITLSDNGDMFVYEGGVYRPGGVNLIRTTAQERLDQYSTKARLNEVEEFIKNTTLTSRKAVNRDAYVINFKNGLYDLNTGKLKPHTPEHLSTIQIPVSYNPNAKCPAIDKFLSEVVSEENKKVLLEFAGYSLIPVNNMKKAIMLLGEGNNGKTVFLKLLQRFVGAENVSAETLQDLNNNSFSSSNLYGKLLNVFPDLGESKLYKTDTFKCLVGGDLIRAEKKFKDPFVFENTARLIFSANSLPEAPNTNDKAYFNRWILVPFPYKFEGKSADRNLVDKLTTEEELSGFLNLALDALRELLKNDAFSNSKSTEEARRMYMAHSDSISSFVEESVERGTGERVYKEEMYGKYAEWCHKIGVEPKALNAFGGRLGKMGFYEGRDTSGDRKRYWIDVTLRA